MAAAKSGKPKRAKGNGKTRTERKPREKKTVEAVNDEQRQAIHFRHVKEYERDLVLKNNADSRLKATAERIKKEGGVIKMIKLAIAFNTEEGERAFQMRIAQEAEVARWHGVGVQLDLFGKQKQTPAEKHFEDGKRAALNDQPAKPPEYLSQRDAEHWLNGHTEGRKALNVERAQGFKPLGEIAGGLVLGPVAQFNPATGDVAGVEPATAN
jgi:hypothetical protein